MKRWRDCTLGDVLEIKHGFAFKGEFFTDEGKHVLLTPGNFRETGGLKLKGNKEKYYNGNFPYEYLLRRGDMLVAMTDLIQDAPILGSPAFIPEDNRFLHNQRLGKVVNLKIDKVAPEYLFYLLNKASVRGQIKGSASGATVRHTSPSRIYEVCVELPPLPVQLRIASVLSAYDDLIEINRGRIRILESMVRSLYREWFVHFRFPGHGKFPRISSLLGKIPQGWKICALGDIVHFKSGFAFKSGTFTAQGKHRLVTIRNVQDGTFHPEADSRISELPESLPPYCVLKDGDILLSLTGNIGRVCLVFDGPFLLNQRVSKLAPVDPFDWAMTYCIFREPEMRVRLEQLSNGVAQQNLSPVLASKMGFVCPPRELRRRFSALAEPMVRRIVQLYSTIQNLGRTRELLLPRLLSGQIELKTEEAVA